MATKVTEYCEDCRFEHDFCEDGCFDHTVNVHCPREKPGYSELSKQDELDLHRLNMHNSHKSWSGFSRLCHFCKLEAIGG